MKKLRILHHYQKGLRLYGLVFGLISTCALLIGILTTGKLNNLTLDRNTLANASEDLYFLVYFPTANEVSGTDTQAFPESYLNGSAGNDSVVEGLYSIRSVSPIRIGDDSLNIFVYDKGLAECFPGLRKLGIDFRDGTCVASRELLTDKSSVTFSFKKKTFTFPVSGTLTPNNRYFNLSTSATNPNAMDFFATGKTIVLRDAPEYAEFLEAAGKNARVQSNLVLRFKADTPAEVREDFLQGLPKKFLVYSYSDVMKNSNGVISRNLKQNLPLPIFLGISSLFAYLSIIVLCIRKKSATLATLYLTGYSKRHCSILATASCFFMAVPSLLVGCLFIVFWPSIVNFLRMSMFGTPSRLQSLITSLYVVTKQITIGPEALVLVLIYTVVVLAVAYGIVELTLRKYTPTEFYRRTLDD